MGKTLQERAAAARERVAADRELVRRLEREQRKREQVEKVKRARAEKRARAHQLIDVGAGLTAADAVALSGISRVTLHAAYDAKDPAGFWALLALHVARVVASRKIRPERDGLAALARYGVAQAWAESAPALAYPPLVPPASVPVLRPPDPAALQGDLVPPRNLRPGRG